MSQLSQFLLLLIERLRKKRRYIFSQYLNDHQHALEQFDGENTSHRTILAMQSNLPRLFFKVNVPRYRSIHRRARRDSLMWSLNQPDNESLYYESFRMNKCSFDLLCEKLTPYLPSPEVFVTPSLPIRKQVAICLYKVASCAEYRVVGDVFGVHKSTVHKYFYLVIKAINNLRKEHIYFPNSEEANVIANSFEKVTHLPNIIGAIDGTHIPILPPSVGYQDYINRKGWPSIVMQAVVDNMYRFRDVSVKFPGSTHDATVFKESGLFKYYNEVIPTYTTDVNGLQSPYMLIGDPAYPLLPWLMKPYTGSLSPEEESFNCYVSSGRIVVENAFGRLKGRWRCLLKRMDIDPRFVPSVVLACSILHNFVETEKQHFCDSWSIDDQNEIEFAQPPDTISNEIISQENMNPKMFRDTLKNFLKNNFPLRKSHF